MDTTLSPHRREPAGEEDATTDAAGALFAGPGEMRALCRELDWSATPLGPVEGWPRCLRTTVGIVLGSRNPMFLWWGSELVQIYNDAYRPSLGGPGPAEDSRHPRALGMRGREFWTDIWDVIGPQIEQVMTTGEPTWHEDQYLPIDRNGRREDVWWTYGYSPVPDDEGGIGGTLVVCQETTRRVVGELERERLLRALELERREVERLLGESERARAEAEAANRAKSEFLAVMSHELRTPLNAIGGYTELLDMGVHGPVSERQRDALARVQLSQRHLLGLINEVLNYAKLETGAVRYDLAAVLVAEALEGAESLVAPQAHAKGIVLETSGASPSLRVLADAEKLRQILVNVLSNAVKFTGPGGRIRMGAEEEEGDRVRFLVSDTGIGIPADRIDAIFDPFVQVRADLTRPHEGTGLGLAISRDLARAMGGDLVAESRAGEGSTFTLTLPRA